MKIIYSALPCGMHHLCIMHTNPRSSATFVLLEIVQLASLYKDTHLVIASRLKNIQLSSLSHVPFNRGHEPASQTHVHSLRLQTPGWLLDKHCYILPIYLDVWERAKQPTGPKLAEIILYSEDTFLFLLYFSLPVPHKKLSWEKQTERGSRNETQRLEKWEGAGNKRCINTASTLAEGTVQ